MMEVTIHRDRGERDDRGIALSFQFENDALEKFLRDSQGLGDELELVSLTALGTGYIVKPTALGPTAGLARASQSVPKSEKK